MGSAYEGAEDNMVRLLQNKSGCHRTPSVLITSMPCKKKRPVGRFQNH